MKNQALFSSKDKSKISKCRLLQFLFDALRVKTAYGKAEKTQTDIGLHFMLRPIRLNTSIFYTNHLGFFHLQISRKIRGFFVTHFLKDKRYMSCLTAS